MWWRLPHSIDPLSLFVVFIHPREAILIAQRGNLVFSTYLHASVHLPERQPLPQSFHRSLLPRGVDFNNSLSYFPGQVALTRVLTNLVPCHAVALCLLALHVAGKFICPVTEVSCYGELPSPVLKSTTSQQIASWTEQQSTYWVLSLSISSSVCLKRQLQIPKTVFTPEIE